MTEETIFRYGNLLRIVTVLVMLFAGMMGYIFSRAIATYRPGDAVYFIVGIPFIVVFATFPLLAYRDIVISKDGMRRSFFGIRSALVRWETIVSVRCGEMSASDGSVKSYHLQTKVGSPFGGVSVMSMIDDVDILVEAIEHEVITRKIPISGWDVNTLVQLDRLPAPAKGPAAWR